MDTVKYWLDTAEDDLITAEALFEKKRFLKDKKTATEEMCKCYQRI